MYSRIANQCQSSVGPFALLVACGWSWDLPGWFESVWPGVRKGGWQSAPFKGPQ